VTASKPCDRHPTISYRFMSRTDASSVSFNLVNGKPDSVLGPVPQAGKLRVQVINTEQGFDALEPTWTALYDEAGTSPFQTFAWQRAWWRRYAEPDPRMRLFILVVRHEAADKESAVTAIAPFLIERRRVAGMVPITRIAMIGRLQSDYLDLLVQPVAASASLAALAGHLRRFRNRFDVLLLQDVPDHSPSFPPFLDALDRRGFRVQRGVGEHCPRITFGQTWEQTEQALPSAIRSKKARYLRRMRQLVEQHGAELELVQDLSRLDEDLADLFALHQQRWTQAGLSGTYGTAVNTGFVREAAHGLAARGQLVLAFLRLDGRRVAGICGFRHRDEFYFYASGLGDAGEAARHSPGIGLHLMLMRALFEDGVRVYDLLRGTEPYKAHLGGIPVPTWRAAAFGRPAGLGRGVCILEGLQWSAQRRFEHERQQLQALRANPACGAADVRRHVAERLAANFTDAASRLRRHR
jgi:CelD/BcsL family acetyltransferase involved in cellulose biosynthesis